jgi:hypothetical protein
MHAHPRCRLAEDRLATLDFELVAAVDQFHRPGGEVHVLGRLITAAAAPGAVLVRLHVPDRDDSDKRLALVGAAALVADGWKADVLHDLCRERAVLGLIDLGLVIGLPDLSSKVFHLPIGDIWDCADAAKAIDASATVRMILRMCCPLPGNKWTRERPTRVLYPIRGGMEHSCGRSCPCTGFASGMIQPREIRRHPR